MSLLRYISHFTTATDALVLCIGHGLLVQNKGCVTDLQGALVRSETDTRGQ